MRIGRANNCLSIERCEPQPGRWLWRIEAALEANGCKFAAVHDRVLFQVTESTDRALGEVAAGKPTLFELGVSEGGWLRCKRNVHGRLILHYRFARWHLGAAIEGEIALEPREADEFCRALRAVLGGEQE